jgi:predicted amidohydrolase YtcJ
MRPARFILASGILALNALHPVVLAQTPSTDLILFNGKVFTSNASQPYVEALAIRGDRIVAVGTSKEVVALASKETRRIDLGGRTVIPGINDAHMHLGVELSHYDLPLKSDDPTWQEMTDALTAAAPKVAKGTWIEGVFGTTILDDPLATKGSLDAIAPDDLVVLSDWTGHASLLNTAAMRKLGIREDEPDPEGGRFVRNHADGKLTGMAFEYAQVKVIDRTGLVSDDEALSQLHGFFDGAARLGITTLQDMASNISAERCAALFERVPPPIRVRVMWMGPTDEHGRATSEGRASNLHPSPLVTVTGTKWVLDGTPIEHSAAMRQPYADRPSTSGELDFSEKEMENMLRESLQRNDQLMVHVVGDRTVETFLNAMEATGGEKVWAQRRVRLEHGDGLMPDLVPRAKRLGVIVVQNPTHFTLGELFVKRFGDKRSQMLLPVRSLLEAGIPVALGSDGPLNPFLNIMLAANHPGNPKEAITREQAIIAYTLTSAYAEFAEKDKGSLEPGKLADLAVLSQDIIKVSAGDLPKTESVLTMVGGKVVYDAKVLTMH